MTANDRTIAQVRADGPAVVRKGPAGQPAVVVIDPLGDAKHGELPATWRSLSEDVEVVWWRLPTMVREGRDVGPLIADLAVERRLYLVGAGDAALLTLSLARQFRVASVVLVDPPWSGGVENGQRIIDDPGVEVFQVNTGPDDALPIGHPEVVRAVLLALVSADLWPDGPMPEAEIRLPAPESLMGGAWDAARHRLTDLLDTLSGPR